MNEPNAYGNTPLHVACYNGQDVVVNELIDSGANVNQKNEKGFTPLHFAAASTHGALCLELLVGNGADVNMKVGAKPKSLPSVSGCAILIHHSAMKRNEFLVHAQISLKSTMLSKSVTQEFVHCSHLHKVLE